MDSSNTSLQLHIMKVKFMFYIIPVFIYLVPSLLGNVHKKLEEEKSELEVKLCEFESINKIEVKLYRESNERNKILESQVEKLEKEILSTELEKTSMKLEISKYMKQNDLFQQTNKGILKENANLKNQVASLKTQNGTLMHHNIPLKNQASWQNQTNLCLSC